MAYFGPNDRDVQNTAAAVQISNGAPYYANANTVDSASGGLVGITAGAFYYVQADQPIYFRIFNNDGAPTASNGILLAANQIFAFWMDSSTCDSSGSGAVAARAVSTSALVKLFRCK